MSSVDTDFPQAEHCAVSVLFSLAFSLGMRRRPAGPADCWLMRPSVSLLRFDHDRDLRVDADAEVHGHHMFTN